MNNNVEIIIDGQQVELSQDTNITLNFNSTMLSDIGQIKTDNSQTIRLPRTPTNDRIFDLALSPSHESSRTHRYMSCACYVDGVTIFDNGRCYLLDSSAEGYEIAMTWGLLHDYSQWLNAKKKLTELTDYPKDYITWNSNSGITILEAGVTQIEDSPSGLTSSMFYKNYYNGLNNVDTGEINISPCVNLLEIWERIRRENSLVLNIDEDVRIDMEKRYIILVKNKNKKLQDYTSSLSLNGAPSYIVDNIFDKTNYDKKSLLLDFSGTDRNKFYDYGYFKPYGDGDTDITIKTITLYYNDANFIHAIKAYPSNYSLEFRYNGIRENVKPQIDGDTLTYNVNRTFTGITKLEIAICLTKWEGITDREWQTLKDKKNEFMLYGNNVSASYQLNSKGYPLTEFRLVPNLPDITQIDFIRFICNWYGLYPEQNINGVSFRRYSVLEDNLDNGQIVDWSEKLVSDTDAPQKISFTLSDYAQKNIIRYKEDSELLENATSIDIDDETLERECVMIEFPFAATRYNIVNQYSKLDNGQIKENGIEYRLMGLDSTGGLFFNDDMNAEYIARTRYGLFQNLLRKPNTIEEEILLTLLDLKSLDYSKPVYLAKYGRFFAIDSIQWTSSQSASKVKLLRIK